MMEVNCDDNFVVDAHPSDGRNNSQYGAGLSQQADDMIRRAEVDKICIVHTPGKDLCHSNNVNCLAMPYGQQYSTTVDENYLVIGSHVDAAMQEKIKRGEYIDFAKLIPRDRPVHDDHRLELVSKG